MKLIQKHTHLAVLLACGTFSSIGHADIPSAAVLDFTDGFVGCGAAGPAADGTATWATGCNYDITAKVGSWFSMDTNGDGSVQQNEITLISNENGIALGIVQAASGSHTEAPDGSETPSIDQPWNFFGNTGMHQSTKAITAASDDGAGNVTLDMEGLSVAWNNIPNIPMGGCQFADAAANGVADTCVTEIAPIRSFTNDGIANLTCYANYTDDENSTTFDYTTISDCVDGAFFVMNHDANVPVGDPSGFDGVPYVMHLEGVIAFTNTPPTVNAVSIANLPAASHNWTPDTDTDFDGDTLTCSIPSQPTNGLATVAADCSTGTYDPTAAAGFSGTDSFTYIANDGTDDSAPATVSIIIDNNPPPLCSSITGATTNAGTAVNITIDVTDSNVCTDVSGNGTIVSNTLSVTTPSTEGGSVSVDSATGIATYTPVAGFSGADTFTYTVDDNNSGTSDPATVTVTVLASGPSVESGTFTVGDTATSSGSADGRIASTDIPVTDGGDNAEQGIAESCIGGCFDFEVSGLAIGSTMQIVLPLSETIPTPADDHALIYRKFNATTSTWTTFDSSGDNAIHTADGTISGSTTVCPAASDSAYDTSPGITPDHECVRLTIVEGGPNDADGLANGTVVDPGGIADTVRIDTRTSSTDGCSMSGTPVALNQRADWLLVAGFLVLLAFVRKKGKAQ